MNFEDGATTRAMQRRARDFIDPLLPRRRARFDAAERGGVEAARLDASAVRMLAGSPQPRSPDRAIQVFGATGLVDDTPPGACEAQGALRFIDGPDAVPPNLAATAGSARIEELAGRDAPYRTPRVEAVG